MPYFPSLNPIYKTFETFTQRCLLEDDSLLWPGRPVWTIEALEQVRRRFVEGFIQGGLNFREKLEAQLAGSGEEVWALVAECFFLYALPARNVRFDTKHSWVVWAAERANQAARDAAAADPNAEERPRKAPRRPGRPPKMQTKTAPEGQPAAGQDPWALPAVDDPLWTPLKMGFAVTGQKYNLKHAQLRLLVLFALEIKASGQTEATLRSPAALQSLLDGVLDAIPLKIDRANDMRNAILYMAFPQEYEPLISNSDKESILRRYGGQVSGELSYDRDEALRQVRRALEAHGQSSGELLSGEQGDQPVDEGSRPFDFFEDLKEEWREDGGLARLFRQSAASGHGVDTGSALQGYSIHERAAPWPQNKEPAPGTSFDVDLAGNGQALDVDVRRTLAALRFTRNVILSGPPGVGKTLAAQQAARWLVENAGGSVEECVWWVALHASFAYEDFVEGIRPSVIQPTAGEVRSTELALPYTVRPGVFREICARAEQDSQHRYVLVLDEINRGSLTKILGELIPLIEDDKRGKLALRLPYSGEKFSVPPNLYLLGTMNTADRSIALIDSALRRRFAFVPFAPRPGLLEGTTVETDEALLPLDLLLERLNAALTGALDSDHQIGHSYFLRVAAAPEEERLSTLEMVWNHQVLPLLEEYFFNRRQRLADILTPFVEDNNDLNARPQFTLLYGEDLVVALSRLCE